MFAVVLLIAGGCSVNIRITGESLDIPVIFPDYRDVTVPYNIAPLNFEVLDGQGKDWALIVETDGKVLSIRAKKGMVSFRNRMWKKMMADNKGTALKLTLCFKDGDGWHSCRPFDINVAGEEMDPYIAYRLIPPGYSLWKEMGIYQRDLSSYKETPIYRNTQGRGNCVNCHSFRDRQWVRFRQRQRVYSGCGQKRDLWPGPDRRLYNGDQNHLYRTRRRYGQCQSVCR